MVVEVDDCLLGLSRGKKDAAAAKSWNGGQACALVVIILQEPAAAHGVGSVAHPEASHGKGAARQLNEWHGSRPPLLQHALW